MIFGKQNGAKQLQDSQNFGIYNKKIKYLISWGLMLAVLLSGEVLGLLSLQTKGQRCLEFVIRGGGNSAIICFHSSMSGPQVR